jgi:uncharacterized repeat protein (TIGR03803 family)
VRLADPSQLARSKKKKEEKMERNECLGTLRTALLIAVATLAWAGGAAASTYNIIHRFTWAQNPLGSLTFDAAGNLYGTTVSGGGKGCGGSGCGAVWKLKPNPSGTWTVSILHVFKGPDGANPGAGLIFDAAGNLYGTTGAGGDSTACPNGCGVVFKLKPNPDGTWTESVLHSFAGGTDGASPAGLAGLIFDATGNLYGTTFYGGSDSSSCFYGGCGVAFKLKPNHDGSWTESIVHTFVGADGTNPSAGLIFDAAGNSYGTTWQGGASSLCTEPGGCGVVFRLKPNPDGSWTESVLHSFGGVDGSFGSAGLIFDTAGNLYGMTYVACGGCGEGGTVFELQPNPDGTWTESVLHSFTGGADGSFPTGGLIFDAAGNLYGTTSEGGAHFGSEGYGVVFKLAPTSSGWSETVLHTFLGVGENPAAPVIFDPAGNLYGTTERGSPWDGLVFEIKP